MARTVEDSVLHQYGQIENIGRLEPKRRKRTDCMSYKIFFGIKNLPLN